MQQWASAIWAAYAELLPLSHQGMDLERRVRLLDVLTNVSAMSYTQKIKFASCNLNTSMAQINAIQSLSDVYAGRSSVNMVPCSVCIYHTLQVVPGQPYYDTEAAGSSKLSNRLQ